MPKFIDLTGLKFNKLTVISRAKNIGKQTAWLCKCDCGNTVIVRADHLKDNKIKGCGCLLRKHGYADKERLYRIFRGMKTRCYNPKTKHYKDYGGRGIKICDEWLKDYMNFRNWAMYNGYNDSLTIDRINVNGNYEPGNCRWVAYKEQIRNRRNTKKIVYDNQIKTISEWAEILNIKYNDLKNLMRYKKIEEIINERWEICGENKT